MPEVFTRIMMLAAICVSKNTNGLWESLGSTDSPYRFPMNVERSGTDLRNAGILLLVSGAEFLLLTMAGEATYPGYSVHTNAISDLGATTASTFWLYEPAIMAWGLFWLLGAYFYWRNRHRRGSMMLNILPGLGILLVAAFPEDVSIILHFFGSAVGRFAGTIVALSSCRWLRSPLRYFFLSLGGISLVGALIEFGSYNSSLMQQTLGPGGRERAIVYPLLLWEIAFRSYLVSRSG